MSPDTAIKVEVHVELLGVTIRAGTAYLSTRRNALTCNFEYDHNYFDVPGAFELSPELSFAAVATKTDGLPGAMADTAPDRWGRHLIERRIQIESRVAGKGFRTATEVDFLLGVSDETRQGAIRYRLGAGDFLSAQVEVPKIIELPRLLNAATLVTNDERSRDDFSAIKALLDAGTGSLGGARPKASIRDGDKMYIAKFPHPKDQWDVEAWEATTLDLASAAGIAVPKHRVVDVDGKNVHLLERFDRENARRIPYISGMTLMESNDGVSRDYLELAESLTERGSQVKVDLHDLWRRIAFSIVVNNTDDHLRNHGFLHENNGWRLSPLFDVNPNPDRSKLRTTSIAFQSDPNETKRALFESAADFDLGVSDAQSLWDQVIVATDNWKTVAARNGIKEHEIKMFSDAFSRHRN